MVSRWIGRVLLAVAVRRWPVHLRKELRQEWSAEMYVLAGEHRPARMLGYAASLAIARPARRSTRVGGSLSGTWRVVRLVLIAPLMVWALLFASAVAMRLIVDLMAPLPFAMDLQLPLWTLFSLGCAVSLTWLGRRWTVVGVPPALLFLAVTVPGFAVSVAAKAAFSSEFTVHASAYSVFFLGLGAVLVAVARLADTGRGRAAWWAGVLGATVIADIAVMLTVLSSNLSPEGTPHLASAPVWLFTALTDSGFGLPYLAGMQTSAIVDVVEMDPLLYLVFAAFALGVVIAGGRQAAPAGRRPPRRLAEAGDDARPT